MWGTNDISQPNQASINCLFIWFRGSELQVSRGRMIRFPKFPPFDLFSGRILNTDLSGQCQQLGYSIRLKNTIDAQDWQTVHSDWERVILQPRNFRSARKRTNKRTLKARSRRLLSHFLSSYWASANFQETRQHRSAWPDLACWLASVDWLSLDKMSDRYLTLERPRYNWVQLRVDRRVLETWKKGKE